MQKQENIFYKDISTNSEYTDTELLEMLCGNHKLQELAFADIYSRYSARVYGYCFKVTGNSEDANDIFQEVFIKFMQTAQERKVGNNIFPFLITVARNLCLNFKRNRKRFVSYLDFEHEEAAEPDYDGKEIGELISKALNMLDVEQRDLIVLKQYQGLTNVEIAKLTNQSENVVKTKYWRAKEKLKKILAPFLEGNYGIESKNN